LGGRGGEENSWGIETGRRTRGGKPKQGSGNQGEKQGFNNVEGGKVKVK